MKSCFGSGLSGVRNAVSERAFSAAILAIVSSVKGEMLEGTKRTAAGLPLKGVDEKESIW